MRTHHFLKIFLLYLMLETIGLFWPLLPLPIEFLRLLVMAKEADSKMAILGLQSLDTLKVSLMYSEVIATTYLSVT